MLRRFGSLREDLGLGVDHLQQVVGVVGTRPLLVGQLVHLVLLFLLLDLLHVRQHLPVGQIRRELLALQRVQVESSQSDELLLNLV